MIQVATVEAQKHHPQKLESFEQTAEQMTLPIAGAVVGMLAPSAFATVIPSSAANICRASGGTFFAHNGPPHVHNLRC
jgi:hypothetical protein